MPRMKVTVYTVREVHWDYNDEFYYRVDSAGDDDEEPYGGAEPSHSVKAFLSKQKAEAHCDELERERWKDENPFCWGDYSEGLAAFTTLPEAAFRWHLEELRLGPVDLDDDLAEWWEDNIRRMSRQQRNGVWALLDRVRFFEVVPMRVDLEE